MVTGSALAWSCQLAIALCRLMHYCTSSQIGLESYGLARLQIWMASDLDGFRFGWLQRK
ncbi:MAG: hypothetical protein WBA57_25390 [Elainellaceae cyanobacterium]